MGHRLSKIYTRTGDAGTTGLGDGGRVAKDDARVEAYGTVDELNSVIGTVIAAQPGALISQQLTDIQHDLFDLGGELCIPGHTAIQAARVATLEQWLDAHNTHLTPLQEFILPGGHAAAAACHVGRTVCRRAERRLTTLAHGEDINQEATRYLNRLSDLLFVMARKINADNGVGDVLWRHERGTGE